MTLSCYFNPYQVVWCLRKGTSVLRYQVLILGNNRPLLQQLQASQKMGEGIYCKECEMIADCLSEFRRSLQGLYRTIIVMNILSCALKGADARY